MEFQIGTSVPLVLPPREEGSRVHRQLFKIIMGQPATYLWRMHRTSTTKWLAMEEIEGGIRSPKDYFSVCCYFEFLVALRVCVFHSDSPVAVE